MEPLSIRSPFEGLDVPEPLVFQFFAVFSRFEYTLKEAGYLQRGKIVALPAWWDFEKELAHRLVVEPGTELEAAISYLNAEPPLVQTRLNGWQPWLLHGTSDIARAIDAACRVRNNLFHGGKHPLIRPPAAIRSRWKQR